MPSSMMPYRYNGGFTIRQAPGAVIFDLEMIHESRVIPTDGRPALAPEVKQWLGESRGRWEGNTLVVETTNFQEGPPLINLAVVGSPPGNRFPHSDQMKITERVVRLNDGTWLYEITTEDPVILTGPFTVRYPMNHDENYWWPEYACHEDNTIVRNYTVTSRHERANPTPEPPQPPVTVAAGLADTLAGHRHDRRRHRARVHEERGRHGQRQADRHESRPHRQAAAWLHDRGSDHVLHAAERRSVAVFR
jgi:hypothetical protein